MSKSTNVLGSGHISPATHEAGCVCVVSIKPFCTCGGYARWTASVRAQGAADEDKPDDEQE